MHHQALKARYSIAEYVPHKRMIVMLIVCIKQEYRRYSKSLYLQLVNQAAMIA